MNRPMMLYRQRLKIKKLKAERDELKAKLEAMSQVIEVVRAVLPNMIAKGPLSEASRLDFALQEFDAAQQEGRWLRS